MLKLVLKQMEETTSPGGNKPWIGHLTHKKLVSLVEIWWVWVMSILQEASLLPVEWKNEEKTKRS